MMMMKYSNSPVLRHRSLAGYPSHTLLKGRLAQAIRALADKGEAGITALEMSSWALRLAAYIHILRNVHGLNIETIDEKNEDGHHGRYILKSSVRLEEPDA